MEAISDPTANWKPTQAPTGGIGNTNSAHNAALKGLPTKCKLFANETEVYSGIQIVVVLSANHQNLILKDGTIVVLQQCTSREFVSTILTRDFQAGSKIVFAGVADIQPNRYLATKILKISDP